MASCAEFRYLRSISVKPYMIREKFTRKYLNIKFILNLKVKWRYSYFLFK